MHFINILWLCLHTYALSVWSILNKNYIRIALQLMTQNFIALFLSYVKNAWNLILKENAWFSSVQFSCSVVSNSLRTRELQDTRPPCPSPTARVHPDPCPLSWWCHPTISSVAPFCSCPASFPASGSFQMSQLFASGGQSIGASASTSVLPMNTQDWSYRYREINQIQPRKIGELETQKKMW